jgi:hypothetical protein
LRRWDTAILNLTTDLTRFLYTPDQGEADEPSVERWLRALPQRIAALDEADAIAHAGELAMADVHRWHGVP